jgi:uncharacterized protein (DUF4415 family)
MAKKKVKIVVDSDVLIHFAKGGVFHLFQAYSLNINISS